MIWKDWPAWLKAGILNIVILFIFSLSLLILFLFSRIVLESSILEGFFGFILMVVWIIVIFPSFILGLSTFANATDLIPAPTLLGYAVIIIFWFLTGAIINLMIGKIRQIRKRREQI